MYFIFQLFQSGNEAGKRTPVTRLWSWKKSSISIVTSLEGDESKLLMRCASQNVRSKSGSKTVAWSGRKKTSLNLMAVMDSMTHPRALSKQQTLTQLQFYIIDIFLPPPSMIPSAPAPPQFWWACRQPRSSYYLFSTLAWNHKKRTSSIYVKVDNNKQLYLVKNNFKIDDKGTQQPTYYLKTQMLVPRTNTTTTTKYVEGKPSINLMIFSTKYVNEKVPLLVSPHCNSSYFTKYVIISNGKMLLFSSCFSL